MMESKIKILLIHTRNIFAQDGASANRWRTIVEGLSTKDGVEIQILITQGYGSVKESKEYGWKGKAGEIAYSYTIFLLHNSLWMRRISGYILSPVFEKFNIFRIKEKIKLFNPKIIWLESNLEVLDIYLKVVRCNKFTNHKLMIELSEYDDIGLIHSTNKLQLYISKRYSGLLLNKILPKADFVLIITKHLLEYYRQFINPDVTKLLHLPMTVDLKRFDNKKEAKDRYLAYCGSSSFVKDGVDILIKSFLMISEKYPDISLKIAAFMEADGGKMLALIKKLNLQDKVEYIGELRRDEIPDFITNAELLLLPRPESKQGQGGFPTKLGEYLATGNPVCATTVGEIPDYLQDEVSAFLAEPGSVNSFADAMQRALNNKEKAAEVGKNGRIVAAQFFNMDIQSKLLFDFLVKEISTD